jgi:hypothetical protein
MPGLRISSTVWLHSRLGIRTCAYGTGWAGKFEHGSLAGCRDCVENVPRFTRAWASVPARRRPEWQWAARTGAGYGMCWPRSIAMFAPVINAASSLARRAPDPRPPRACRVGPSGSGESSWIQGRPAESPSPFFSDVAGRDGVNRNSLAGYLWRECLREAVHAGLTRPARTTRHECDSLTSAHRYLRSVPSQINARARSPRPYHLRCTG